MKKEKFKIKNVVNKKMIALISKDKAPTLRILKIDGSSFSGKLIFVDVKVAYKPRTYSEIVLTFSPMVAKYMLSALKKEIKKTEQKGNFKRFVERRNK